MVSISIVCVVSRRCPDPTTLQWRVGRLSYWVELVVGEIGVVPSPSAWNSDWIYSTSLRSQSLDGYKIFHSALREEERNTSSTEQRREVANSTLPIDPIIRNIHIQPQTQTDRKQTHKTGSISFVEGCVWVRGDCWCVVDIHNIIMSSYWQSLYTEKLFAVTDL